MFDAYNKCDLFSEKKIINQCSISFYFNFSTFVDGPVKHLTDTFFMHLVCHLCIKCNMLISLSPKYMHISLGHLCCKNDYDLLIIIWIRYINIFYWVHLDETHLQRNQYKLKIHKIYGINHIYINFKFLMQREGYQKER